MYGMRAGKRAGWTAIFVAAALVFALFPGAAYGDTDPPEEMYESFEDITDPDPDDPIVYDEPYIIEELSTLREMDVKQYMMSDGTMEKVIFSEPVHYMDEEGEWAEIDNSLELALNEYDTKDHPDLATDTDDGTVTVPEFVNAANSFELRIAQEADQNNMVALEEDGLAISFSPIYDPLDYLEQWQSTGNNKSATTVPSLSAEAVEIPPGDPSAPTPDLPDDEHAFIEIERPETEITFSNERAGVDFQYVPTNSGIKENIIVREGGKSVYRYSFALSLTGLEARLNTHGAIEIADRSTGEVRYVLPAPFMHDEDGAYSSAVSFDLRPIHNLANLQEMLIPEAMRMLALEPMSLFSDFTPEEIEWILEPVSDEAAAAKADAEAAIAEAQTPHLARSSMNTMASMSQAVAFSGTAGIFGAGQADAPDPTDEPDPADEPGLESMSDDGGESDPVGSPDATDPNLIEEDDVPDTAHEDYYEDHEAEPTPWDEEEEDVNLNLPADDSRRREERGRALRRKLQEPGAPTLYIFNVTADAGWINDAERAMPVTIDPVLSVRKKNTLGSSFQTLCTHYDNEDKATVISDHSDGVMHAGVKKETITDEYGFKQKIDVYCETGLVFDAFPELSGAAISKATLRVASKRKGVTKMVAIVDERDEWGSDDERSDSQVLDFATVPEAGGIAAFSLTKLLAHGAHAGLGGWLSFKFVPYNTAKKTFTEMAVPSRTAFLTLTYRAVSGLDGRWSTHSQSIGRAGTGYVNDYAGNLTFVHSDSATPGGRMPASVEHIYNGNEVWYGAMNPLTFTGAGRGWKLNYQQTLTIPVGEADTNKYPYVWVDGDGTKHFFKRQDVSYYENGAERKVKADNGAAADEDGLGLYVVPVRSNAPNDMAKKYPLKIVDKGGNLHMYFNRAGNLGLIRDANGREDGKDPNKAKREINEIEIAYGEATGEKLYYEGSKTLSAADDVTWANVPSDHKRLKDEHWDELFWWINEYRRICNNPSEYSDYGRDFFTDEFMWMYDLVLQIERDDPFIRRDRTMHAALNRVKTNLAWLCNNPNAPRVDRLARLDRARVPFNSQSKVKAFNASIDEIDALIRQRIKSVTDGAGVSIDISYKNGRIDRISDPVLGGDVMYEYDKGGKGDLMRIKYPAEAGAKRRESLYTYNSAGYLTSATDWTGYRVEYDYEGGSVSGVSE
ncbi:MAG: hypothetical protein FWH32_08370, partial [Clostridiales bacterium]|nr:hypothetical protein [Clostridiales bacterium]